MTEKEKEVQTFMDSLTPDQMKDLQTAFVDGLEKYNLAQVEKLEALKTELEQAKKLKNELVEIANKDYNKENWDNKSKAYAEIERIENLIVLQENLVKATQNLGGVVDISDQYGFEYKNVPDFRKVDTTEFSFDERNVLTIPVPKYVPVIDEERFAQKSFVFDSIRVTEDSYLISVNGYKNGLKGTSKDKNNFVIVTLDQLVLIIDYYYSKAKATNIAEAKRRTQRSEDNYNSLSVEQRTRYLFQRGIYGALPAKVKKEVTPDEWEKLDLEGREKLYKPFKTYGAKRLVSKLDEHHMGASFHYMYEDFINKNAITVDKNGNPDRNSRNANPIVWKYWSDFREMINFKIKDIKIQREDYSDTYKQAIETSFGESNVDTILKEKYGILVKRQNGDKIKPNEVDLIERSWISVQKVFGNLKANALKYNLKISHSGTKLMFAMKALGVYIPSMGTIGVSNKLGDSAFTHTLSHESAHFIDNFIGELNSKRYATDNYEGLAGKIAFTFRNMMNKPKSQQTDYINATKECFARAFEQYFAIKNEGENAITMNVDSRISENGIEYVKHPNFVNLAIFNSDIKPLIEQFLSENLDVFETTVDLDGTNDLAPITEEPKESIQDLIDGLEILKDISEGKEKEDYQDLIDGLKLLLDNDEFELGGEITHELKSADVETGKKVTFWSLHTRNKQKTQNFGSRFGQNIEPDGRYIIAVSKNTSQLEDNSQSSYEYGFTTFENPVVLEHKSTDDKGWKKDLSEMFGGKIKRALSKEIIKKGYDGIITTDGNWTSEIVDLRSFR